MSTHIAGWRSPSWRSSQVQVEPNDSKTNISSLARGEQPDGRNPEILENLRAQANFAPLTGACRICSSIAVRNVSDWHAGRAVAQIDNYAAASRFEACKRGPDRFGTAENIANYVGTMQSRQYAIAIANRPIDKGHVVHAIKRGDVGVTPQRPDLRRQRE